MTLDYDPTETPDPDEWLETDEDDQLQAVLEYHKGRRDHPPAQNMEAHAGVHAIVENQIASNEPPETGQKVRELVDAGIDRHAAIHAVMVPVSHAMYGLLDDADDPRERMVEKIADVTVEDGREQEKTWG